MSKGLLHLQELPPHVGALEQESRVDPQPEMTIGEDDASLGAVCVLETIQLPEIFQPWISWLGPLLEPIMPERCWPSHAQSCGSSFAAGTLLDSRGNSPQQEQLVGRRSRSSQVLLPTPFTRLRNFLPVEEKEIWEEVWPCADIESDVAVASERSSMDSVPLGETSTNVREDIRRNPEPLPPLLLGRLWAAEGFGELPDCDMHHEAVEGGSSRPVSPPRPAPEPLEVPMPPAAISSPHPEALEDALDLSRPESPRPPTDTKVLEPPTESFQAHLPARESREGWESPDSPPPPPPPKKHLEAHSLAIGKVSVHWAGPVLPTLPHFEPLRDSSEWPRWREIG